MVTIREIADAVGVAPSTVSRVLNFDTSLSITAKRRQAIIETAEAMNYLTPRRRRRISLRGMKKVALVHFLRPDQELADPYYVGMRLGIESRCHARKIETVTAYHTDRLPDPGLLQDAPGVIVVGRHEDDEISWLEENGKHIVFADYAPSSARFDSVLCDLELATRRLMQTLTDMGLRRIAFVGWNSAFHSPGQTDPDARWRAYIQWMKAAGKFDERLCRTDRNTEESGYRMTRALLDETGTPDALITGNDNIAVGAYRAIHEKGLSIPGDLAVASFNNISVAQFLNPPLSTVMVPFKEIGETAVDLLLERGEGRSLSKKVILESQLILRGSTPPFHRPVKRAQ